MTEVTLHAQQQLCTEICLKILSLGQGTEDGVCQGFKQVGRQAIGVYK